MLKELVHRVIQAGSTTEHLEHTGWLGESTPEEIQGLYATYREKFKDALEEVRTEVGEPDHLLQGSSGWFSQWYPEAFAAAAWRIQDGWLCLAAEHFDRETPISLLVRSLTTQELEELAE